MRTAWLLLVTLIAGLAVADERILAYHTDIHVRTDGWIEVTETIRVRAEGNQIRRGIYRDYPTDYVDRFDNEHEALYEPRSLTRNGNPEPFNSQDYRNGVRTYFGSSDVFLATGEHTYVYRYDAGRMIGFFEDGDELWWNVTGNGWAFPIDRATASVTFGFGVNRGDLTIDAWQGAFGSVEEATRSFGNADTADYEASRVLAPGEGLSIYVSWPKGLVPEPTALQKLTWVLSDNLNLLIALAGLSAMISYYIPVWKNYGRDPEPGVVFTRYQPPDGYSPASLRYIENMYYDDTMMTAAIINLAVKGYLRINEDDGDHTLTRTDPGDDPPPLAAGERELHDALFVISDHVILDDEYHEMLGLARTAHRKSLERDYKNRYFKLNGALNLPPLLIGVISVVIALQFGPSPFVFVTIALMIITLVTFAILMRRPTGPGRALLDEAEGFREYLEIAEKDEMNLRNPPEKTPQLFERYLPFALALGVEQEWADRFTRIFATLEGPNDTTWHPSWYNGSWNNIDLGTTTSSFSSSLGTSISSSVSPPGSSSGGGGGGFSGGGGGGGGGGGW